MSIEDEMRHLAEALQSRAPSIAGDIHQRLLEEVPEYYESGDPAVLANDLRSTQSSLQEIFDGLAHGRTPPERASGTNVEDARLAAQAGIDLQALLRTYRVGQAVCLQAIIEQAEADIADRETRVAVLTLAAQFQFAWNDRVMATLVETYQHERDVLFRDRERKKRELIRDVINGLPVDSGRLAYNLRGEHLAVIAWGASPDIALQQLAGVLEGPLLSVAGTAGAMYAWVGGDGLAKRWATVVGKVEPPDSTFLAFGEPASALDGFRASHRQALQGYRVAHVRSHPVTYYRDIALEALVARDLQLARDFVAYELGVIAGDNHRDTVLRATLKAYFQTGQNASSAAHVLGVHERTVAYRLRSVEQRLGVPVSARRDELSIALRLIDLVRATPASAAGLGELLAVEDSEPSPV